MTCIQVNQCCCGCTLRTGTLIIGWVFMVLAVILTVISIIYVLTARSKKELSRSCADYCSYKNPDELYECVDSCYNAGMAFMDVLRYANIWFFLAWLLLCFALVVGAVTYSPVLLLVFLYGYIGLLAIHNMAVLAIVAYYGVTLGLVCSVIVFLIWWALMVYCFIVVASFYKEMSSTEQLYPMEYRGTTLMSVANARPSNYPQQGLYASYAPGMYRSMQGGSGPYPPYPPGPYYPRQEGPSPCPPAPNYPTMPPLSPQTGTVADKPPTKAPLMPE